MTHKLPLAFLFCAATCGAAVAACRSGIRYDGLGVPPPPGQVAPFGAMLVTSAETRARVVTIHPDGGELYYTLLSPSGPQIMQSLYRDGKWQSPTRAAFSDEGVNTEPSISPDGRSLFFISNRPPSKGTDIWRTDRQGKHWSRPVRLDDGVNGAGFEWHPQVTANGDLYFAAADRADGRGDADLYVASSARGHYLPAENLGAPINTAGAEWDPYVSAAGDYLLFKSTRDGGQGGRDLYISTRQGASWSAPRNLGPVINTSDDEDAAEVTPDGRYLTFARSAPGAEAWQMYWIDARSLPLLPTGPGCR